MTIMSKYILLSILILVVVACNNDPEISSINPVNWSKRKVELASSDSLVKGRSYLSVYSQVYSMTERSIHNLTVMVSIRNTSDLDSMFILKSEYYDTKGGLIRTYFDHPIYIAPLETVEIIIDEKDKTGGTGGNFMFDWAIRERGLEPLFEAIMISTSGQQGLSFVTQGKKIR